MRQRVFQGPHAFADGIEFLAAIGTTIRLSDQPAEVIGIAPPEFEDPIA
ncbi:MAG: hypothetical protein ACREM1_00835 [Longimicrobiales bacterium]